MNINFVISGTFMNNFDINSQETVDIIISRYVLVSSRGLIELRFTYI